MAKKPRRSDSNRSALPQARNSFKRQRARTILGPDAEEATRRKNETDKEENHHSEVSIQVLIKTSIYYRAKLIAARGCEHLQICAVFY